jgi:hypothetical protein
VSDRKPLRVPVIPNEALVRGKLVSIKTRGDGGSDFDIIVDNASDVSGYPNFAHSYIGQTIRLSVPPGVQFRDALKENNSIEARVAYRGDERGGRFNLVDDHIRKL